MTQKKKAELQRKLSIAPVPRPPDDLAGRIKADIPEFLRTDHDRKRFSSSVAFSLRVAASILLVITSAFLGIRLLSSPDGRLITESAAPASAAFEMKDEQAAEVTVMIEESAKKEADASTLRDVSTPPAPAPALPRQLAVRERLALPPPTPAPPAAPPARAEMAEPESSVAAYRPRVVPPVAAPPPPAAAAPQLAADLDKASADAPAEARRSAIGGASLREVAVTPKSAGILNTVHAGLSYEAPRALFDVSIDPDEFDRLRKMVESKTTPEPQSVNVEALVNHFAGAGLASRQDVALEVEASLAPIPDSPAMLRVTIDTASLPEEPAGSRPPAATDATLEIEIRDTAVAGYSIVGSGELKAGERILLKGASVTRLIELTVKPGLERSREVARVTLRYRSVRTGREVVLSRSVLARDVAGPWTAATRRHRLATLGAMWGESLQGTASSGEEVARKAANLSSEEPEDARARELAAAATASSRLRGAGPTGSAR
ncbi:MAG TPA: hypothetical protein VMS98_20765 [Thermoanaerobaculia bacterium]|nr:hypothetical protein [Thermoanaerobaculia bacterium]